MESVKSAPADRRTREDGKKRSDVIVLLCALRDDCRASDVEYLAADVDCRSTEPSRYPVANWEESGEIANAVMRCGYRPLSSLL